MSPRALSLRAVSPRVLSPRVLSRWSRGVPRPALAAAAVSWFGDGPAVRTQDCAWVAPSHGQPHEQSHWQSRDPSHCQFLGQSRGPSHCQSLGRSHGWSHGRLPDRLSGRLSAARPKNRACAALRGHRQRTAPRPGAPHRRRAKQRRNSMARHGLGLRAQPHQATWHDWAAARQRNPASWRCRTTAAFWSAPTPPTRPGQKTVTRPGQKTVTRAGQKTPTRPGQKTVTRPS